MSLIDLFSWEKQVFEPPLTLPLTTLEVKQFLSKPMEVPSWPLHTQSVEHCVKQVIYFTTFLVIILLTYLQVTEASAKVYSHEKRKGLIRSQEASRKLMKSNNSQQDVIGLLGIID